MRISTVPVIFYSILLFCISACSASNNISAEYIARYRPDNQKLYDEIVYQDSVFFDAYNTCNIHLDKYGSFYAENIEFYMIRAGL